MLVLKVKEPTDEHFRLVSLTSLTFTSLQKAIRKRYKKSRGTPVERILLLPDIIIEKNDDVQMLQQNATLEVRFGTPVLTSSASLENVQENSDEEPSI
jgi:hypothetical protein